MVSLDQAMEKYRTANGGPEMRQYMVSLDNLNLAREREVVKKEALGIVQSLYVLSQGEGAPQHFDPQSLVDLAYGMFGTHTGDSQTSNFERGVFILQGADVLFGLSPNESTILELGYNSITNHGDHWLQVIEREYPGFPIDLGRVMKEAYPIVKRHGFTSRAVDALCYAHEHGAAIDFKQVDLKAVEQSMTSSLQIGSEPHRAKAFQCLERQLGVFKKYLEGE